MEYPKVLIAAPQHSSKMYAWNRYYKKIKELTYPNYEVFLVDNSDTSENTNVISSYGINCKHLPPQENEDVLSRIARSHEECRRHFLDGDFEYMLHLETDVIPPLDVIERLMQKRKSAVSAVYDIGTGFETRAMIQPIAMFEHGNIVADRDVQELGRMETVFIDGSTKKCFGFGLGCVLMTREVVQMIPFRHDPHVFASADSFWANDMFASNVPVYVATDVYCDHYNRAWQEKPAEFKVT